MKVLGKLSDMTYFTEKLMQENKKYKKFIEDFQLGVNLFPQEKNIKKLKGSMREEVENPLMDKMGLNMSVWNPSKNNFPNFKHSFHVPDNCFKKGSLTSTPNVQQGFTLASPIQINKRLSRENLE